MSRSGYPRAMHVRFVCPFTGAPTLGGSDDLFHIDGRWNGATVRRKLSEWIADRNYYRSRGSHPAFPISAIGYETIGQHDYSGTVHPLPIVGKRDYSHRIVAPVIPGEPDKGVFYVTITRNVPTNMSSDPGYIHVYAPVIGAPLAGIVTRFTSEPATYPRNGRGTFTPGSETAHGKTYDGVELSFTVNASGGSARQRALSELAGMMARRILPASGGYTPSAGHVG